MTPNERQQMREARREVEFYDDGQVAEPAPEVKCRCWFNKEELVLAVDGCAEHEDEKVSFGRPQAT